jgi:DNA-binding transcriptional regulator LsrR (DeoR family)
MKQPKVRDLDEANYRRALLAYLMGQGLDEGDARAQLANYHFSLPTASRDKDAAHKRRWLVTRFAEEMFDEAILERIRDEIAHRPWAYNGLEGTLRELSGGVLKSVWVFHAGDEADPGNQTEWDWQIGNLARNSAWLIQKLLLKSRTGIAVGWGKTVAESIDAIMPRFAHGRERDNGTGRKKLLVIPTVGTPPGAAPSDVDHSSSQQAANLSEAMNGTSKDCPSLHNTWPVEPPDMNEDERRGFQRANNLPGGGFERIYGSFRGTSAQTPLIDTVDTALTSAGAFHHQSFFLTQLRQTGKIDLDELQTLAEGDLGSALVPKEGMKRDSAEERRFNETLRLLPGIKLAHYRDIAQRAARDPDGAAGVILVVLGQNKAKIALSCIRQQAVSVLVADYHLAAALKKVL